MAAATTIAIAGLAMAGAGTAVNYAGQQQQAKASREAERIRERQMRVDADRARTQALRTAMRERALSNATSTSQGAYAGSGAAGGFSQIMSNAGNRVGAVNTNEFLGEQLFRANDAFVRGGQVAYIGTGMTRLGAAGFGSAQTLGNMMQGPQALDPTWSYTVNRDHTNQWIG